MKAKANKEDYVISDFKKEKIEAMKARNADAVSALNSVISKLMLLTIDKREKGQEMTDADSVTVLQKVAKELIEERDAFALAGRAENIVSLEAQIAIINKYLPKMLTDAEIEAIISELEDKSLPAVMRHFKANYAGKCDMKAVNAIIAKNK